MENARELILDMLMEILEKGAYSHLVIRNVLDKYNYRKDRAFLKRVTEGTLERLIQIDHVLDQFSKVPVSKMKPLIRNLLRFSVYQLLFMDSVPESAVCNEAVKLAGKRGFKGLSGYVNGVLRNIARNKDSILNMWQNLPEDESAQRLALSYSMPQWIVELWLTAYGAEKTRMMLEEFLKAQPVTVRLKESLKEGERQKWLEALEKAGVKAWQHPWLSYAFCLQGSEGIGRLPGYQEGLFAVQDVSSMLAVEAALGGISDDKRMAEAEGRAEDPGKEILLLDVCAAPGGKSLHAAEKLQHSGHVISRDLTEYKVSLIRDNIERMSYKNIQTAVFDAAVFEPESEQKADVVLADLPCSGLGVMGKKRDIRHRLEREQLARLQELQKQILNVVWRYVKPGGVLLYSTCTVNPGENQEMVQWFLKEHPFRLESLTPYLPEELGGQGENGMLQLFPGVHPTDGFFLARLRRLTK